MFKDDKTYDRLKTIALVIAPAIAFISALINIWHIPHGDAIVASLTAFDTLIGSLVLVAKAVYDKKHEEGSEEDGNA